MHQWYADFFAKIDGVTLFSEPSADFYSNHWLSAIVIDPEKTGGKTSTDLRLALESANIESRPLWKPMHLQPIFRSAEQVITGVSDRLFDQGLCLPSGSAMTREDVDRVVAVIRQSR